MKYQINRDKEKIHGSKEKTGQSPEPEWSGTSQQQVEARGQWRNVFKILKRRTRFPT